jgi:purine-binding chemotaxis protein CheW
MEAILNPRRARAAEVDGVRQLIVFKLDGREFALPVENVSEVLRMVTLAPVPEGPSWLPGVINLRGVVVPVVDLRTRLGLPRERWGVNTPIIVAECVGKMLGLLADAVVELLTVPSSSISPPDPEIGGTAGSVSGVARAGERLIFIFDLERLYVGTSVATA